MRKLPLTIKLGMLAALVAAGLLIGMTHLGPAPQSAEASFLTEIKKLLASDAQAEDIFGESIAVSGDTAIVGAPEEDAGGLSAGAAYVFQRNQGGADNWGEVTKLTASDAQVPDDFGISVAVSGDIAVVGARYEEAGGSMAGAAYVFHRNQGGADNWGEVAKFTASDAQAGDRFGESVAVSGDTAVVGAGFEDAGGNSAGAAYVFQRDQGGADNWGEVKKLTASDAQPEDFFGYSVAVSGDVTSVGAVWEDAGGSKAGAAYIFQRDQGGADNWGEVKKLTASDAQANDRFGESVAVSGDTAVIGARDEDAAAGNAGATYIFQRNQGGADNWGEVMKLTASDAQANDWFGHSVAVSGNTAVIGAFLEDAGGSQAGAAYVFQRDQGGADNWGEVAKLASSDGQSKDQLGLSVAVSGNTVALGAPAGDAAASEAGAGYVFDLLSPKTTPTPSPTPTITPTPTPTPTPTITPVATDTPTPLPMGGAMSLRVDPSQQAICGSPTPGKVCVQQGQKFDVIVVADEIPASGYILAEAWIDYDDQGLVHKKSTQTQWPDCELNTFLFGQDEASNGAFAACLTGLPTQPASFYVGDLYSFSLTCTTSPSSSDIQILPFGDPVAGNIGTLFVEFGTNAQLVPALSGITVTCAPPGPHKLPHPGDTDGDGCSDWQENGSDETLGGLRNWKSRWDFYDVLGPGAALPKDKIIDLPNDILGVIQRFSPSGAPPYDAAFDRGPSAGPNPWNMTAPDGVIDLPNDILGVIQQYNHSCQ